LLLSIGESKIPIRNDCSWLILTEVLNVIDDS
jgi:hypothetical protein